VTYKKELWERRNLPIKKGVIKCARRRKTKTQLVEEFQQTGGKMSPKLNTQVREGADDIVEGIAYQITSVEEITTDVQSLTGVRVTVTSQKGEEGNTVLWKRPVTGTTSKLGVFITMLGDDTDKWLNKWIKFVTWQPRNRVLEIIPAPTPKASKSREKTA